MVRHNLNSYTVPFFLELSLVGHLTYRYIDGTYTDILICIDIILNFSKGV